MPVALYFGILTSIFSYGVCLPLGIVKAIKHRTPIDNVSSVVIFLGYASSGICPRCVWLLVYFGAVKPIFPMVGLASERFRFDECVWEQIKDRGMALRCLPLSELRGGRFCLDDHDDEEQPDG